MKIAVFGATGKTGIQIVGQALDHGHEVTVMVRNPDRLPKFSKSVNMIVGDINNQDAVRSTIIGQDAVVCALGARELYKNSGVRTKGTQAIIQGMNVTGVKRLVVMSSMGIGESWNTLPMFSKLLFKLVMPAAREDHEAQEQAVTSSTVDWTIIRPSGLIDESNVSTYEYGENISPKTSRISRANVADLILKVLESNILLREAVTISN